MEDRTSYLLERFTVDDMRECSAAIRELADSHADVERVGGGIARLLYERLVDGDGRPANTLVRVYRTQPFKTLPADAQEFARTLLEEGEPDPMVRCLRLIGTAGDLEDWNDPRRSRGHRAIPLPGEEFVRRLPMITQLIAQIGFEVGTVVSPPRGEALVRLAQQTSEVFHVEHAEGSPYLPAQDEFVRPHAVRSAVGFGGMLPSGDFYAVVLFSKVPISPGVARTLKILSLAVRVPLLAAVTREPERAAAR